MSSIEKIKIKDAIKLIEIKNYATMKGWEYLTYNNGTHYSWLPTKKVVNKFKDTIGDKWDTGTHRMREKTYCDLLHTNIVIDGFYIIARGGLCPSGVRLFEIVDLDTLKLPINPKNEV